MLQTILEYVRRIEIETHEKPLVRYTVKAYRHDWSTGQTKIFIEQGDDLLKLISTLELGLRAAYDPIELVVKED